MRDTNLFNINHKIKGSIIGFIALLGSGVISTLGFILLTSRRWQIMEVSVSNFIVLFVQWQLFGLTIAKLGSEQVIFAEISKDKSVFINFDYFLKRFTFPASLLFSVVIGYYFSYLAALVCFFCIFLDSYSIFIMADLNARRSFIDVACANLLNYPLFFFLLLLLSLWIHLSISIVLVIFFLGSLFRFAWLYKSSYKYKSLHNIIYKPNIIMGFQQTLNYLLFRIDNIILVAIGYSNLSINDIAVYLFLAKFPEIVSGVMVSFGTVVFPYFYVVYPINVTNISTMLIKHKWYLVLYLLFGGVSVYIYSYLYVVGPINKLLLLPFLIHSLLIVFVNCFSFSMIRQGYLIGLVKLLFLATFIGACLFLIFNKSINMFYLAWIVPVQLTVFIIISFYFHRGEVFD